MPQRQTAKRCFVRLYIYFLSFVSHHCHLCDSCCWFTLLQPAKENNKKQILAGTLPLYLQQPRGVSISKIDYPLCSIKVVCQPIITSHHKDDNDHQPASRYKLSTHFIQAAAQRRDRCLQLMV